MSTTLENANFAYESGDFATARRLYEALAKAGHANTLVPLARMYLDGQGGSVDLDRAEVLLDQAVALGVREGVFQKAFLFRARGDRAGYFRNIRDAASMGIVPAQYQLALCYKRGDGVPIDSARALQIMRATAKLGHVGAKLSIARRLLSNPLRPVDFLTGLFLYIYAFLKGIYLVFRNPSSDQFR